MITHHTVQANGIKQHYVEAGNGPPVILLHGFPETWYAWRKQIPVLAERYRVIVPDLRGYGETEKPAAGYDKRTMAADIRALMRTLEIARGPIIGHDRGARVATRFAKDHPEAITHLGVFANVPTRVIFERMDATIARPLVLHLQPGARPAGGPDPRARGNLAALHSARLDLRSRGTDAGGP